MAKHDFEDLIPNRNAWVHRRHRREVFWQVTFPLAFGTLLLLGVCGLTIGAASGGVSITLWRDVSMIWMLFPSLVLALIPLALLAGLAYGVFRLIGILPVYFFKLQRFFESISARATQASAAIASPVIGLRGAAAGAARLWRSLTGSNGKTE